MSRYKMKNAERGYHAGHCMKCAKKLRPEATVWLELDQRTGAYHDFGGVPESDSQGAFEFGPDCAEIMRREARDLLGERASA